MFSATYHSPAGRMLLVASDTALVGAWFEGQKHFGGSGLPAAIRHTETPLLATARAWLNEYFAGRRPGDPPMLAPTGTPFQLAVWQMLRQIPYGSTITYGVLAAHLSSAGIRTSPRAVGTAIGRNPISIFIPCHRVIGASGALTGFAAGLSIKSFLLQLEENVLTSSLP